MRRALVEMPADRFRGLDRAGRALSAGPDGQHSRLLRPRARPREGRIRPSAPGADPQGHLRRHHLSGPVQQVAKDLAGYSLAQADMLRHAMGKKSRRRSTHRRERFVTGAVNRRIDKSTADAIFDTCAKFAEYGFNKSHSAPYAFITYQTAWFKANHPANSSPPR